MFPSSTKREFRHFHVVVGQRRQRNVQKKRDARAKLLFCFCRSRCRPRRRCLSSLFYLKVPNGRRGQRKSTKVGSTATYTVSGTVYWAYHILPFRIVACKFQFFDNLSLNSCMLRTQRGPSPMPNFKPRRAGYKSMYYAINNTRPRKSERGNRDLHNPQVCCLSGTINIAGRRLPSACYAGFTNHGALRLHGRSLGTVHTPLPHFP